MNNTNNYKILLKKTLMFCLSSIKNLERALDSGSEKGFGPG